MAKKKKLEGRCQNKECWVILFTVFKSLCIQIRIRKKVNIKNLIASFYYSRFLLFFNSIFANVFICCYILNGMVETYPYKYGSRVQQKHMIFNSKYQLHETYHQMKKKSNQNPIIIGLVSPFVNLHDSYTLSLPHK